MSKFLCPSCGSANTSPVRKKSKRFMIRHLGRHKCLSCNEKFDPPMPGWLGPLIMLGGAGCIYAAVVFVFPQLIGETPEDRRFRVGGPLLLVFFGLTCLKYGYNLLVGREKKLR